MYYNSAFQQYAKSLSLSRYDPISAEKEREYLLNYRTLGCVKSFSSLVEANLRFVIYILKNMNIPAYINPMDLVQEGVLGLIAGIEKYDFKKFKVKLSTYSMSWIRFYISQAILTYRGNKHLVFASLQEIETAENGDRHKNKEKEIVAAEESSFFTTEQSRQMVIDHVLSSLPPRERSILILYHGLEYPYISRSLQDIGVMLHLNFERVRQLKDEALKALKVSPLLEEIYS